MIIEVLIQSSKDCLSTLMVNGESYTCMEDEHINKHPQPVKVTYYIFASISQSPFFNCFFKSKGVRSPLHSLIHSFIPCVPYSLILSHCINQADALTRHQGERRTRTTQSHALLWSYPRALGGALSAGLQRLLNR